MLFAVLYLGWCVYFTVKFELTGIKEGAQRVLAC